MPDILMQTLGALIPLPPLVAAAWIGIALTLDPSPSDASECPAARIAQGTAALSLFAALTLALSALLYGAPGQVHLGTWLASGKVQVALSLSLDALGLAMAVLVAFICLLTLRFSVHYLHREPGFRRFFMTLSLFTGAMLLIVTAGNAAVSYTHLTLPTTILV